MYQLVKHSIAWGLNEYYDGATGPPGVLVSLLPSLPDLGYPTDVLGPD